MARVALGLGREVPEVERGDKVLGREEKVVTSRRWVLDVEDKGVELDYDSSRPATRLVELEERGPRRGNGSSQRAIEEDAVDDRALDVDDPDVTVDDPDVTVDDPDVTVDDPDVTVDDPDVTVDDRARNAGTRARSWPNQLLAGPDPSSDVSVSARRVTSIGLPRCALNPLVSARSRSLACA
jgi:hypothetical protein